MTEKRQPRYESDYPFVTPDIPTSIEVNGKPLAPTDFERVGITPTPGFDGFARGYGIDEDTGIAQVGHFHQKTGTTILRLKLINTGDKPVDIQTPDMLSPVQIDPSSGYGWVSHLYMDAIGDPEAGSDKTNELLRQGPRFAPWTAAPGSRNMNFHLPAAAWVDWFGKSTDSVDFFNRYWLMCCARPRQWVDPQVFGPMGAERIPLLVETEFANSGYIRNPQSPYIPGFNEGATNSHGLNAWDRQHADMLELIEGLRIFNDPAFLEEALIFYTSVWRNGWELLPDNVNKQWGGFRVCHSPRSWGWDWTNSGMILQAMAGRHAGTYDWLAEQVIQWGEYTLHTWTEAFPDGCRQPASWSLNHLIQQAGDPMSSPWQMDSTIPWGAQEFAAGLRAYFPGDARAEALATAFDALAESALDYADANHHVTADEGGPTALHFLTPKYRIPAGFPGIGCWPIAPGLRSPKGLERRSTRELYNRLSSNWGLSPNREDAVNYYRPKIEEAMLADPSQVFGGKLTRFERGRRVAVTA